jgi:hypothetical protein
MEGQVMCGVSVKNTFIETFYEVMSVEQHAGDKRSRSAPADVGRYLADISTNSDIYEHPYAPVVTETSGGSDGKSPTAAGAKTGPARPAWNTNAPVRKEGGSWADQSEKSEEDGFEGELKPGAIRVEDQQDLVEGVPEPPVANAGKGEGRRAKARPIDAATEGEHEKSKLCVYHMKLGKGCRYGDDCRYAHVAQQLRRPMKAAGSPSGKGAGKGGYARSGRAATARAEVQSASSKRNRSEGDIEAQIGSKSKADAERDLATYCAGKKTKFECQLAVGIVDRDDGFGNKDLENGFDVVRLALGHTKRTYEELQKEHGYSAPKIRMFGKGVMKDPRAGTEWTDKFTKLPIRCPLEICVSADDRTSFQAAFRKVWKLLEDVYADYAEFCRGKGLPPRQLSPKVKKFGKRDTSNDHA